MVNKSIYVLLIFLIAFSHFGVSQQWNGSTNINGNIYRNGNVGIGTGSPSAKLDVVGQTQTDYLRINAQNTSIEGGELRLDGATNAINPWFVDNYGGHFRLHHSGAEYLRLTSAGDLSAKGRFRWGTTGALLNTDQGASIELRGHGVPYFDFSNDASTDFDMRLILVNNDLLGIQGGNLAVDGVIKTKEVSVQNNVWADFVFKPDYKLSSLSEVEKHIKEKGHLKDIPSAKEVAENGTNLGEMDAKLLQKIEELTLYLIQQQKEIEKLNDKIENMN